MDLLGTYQTIRKIRQRQMNKKLEEERVFNQRVDTLFSNMYDDVDEKLTALYTKYADENGYSYSQALGMARLTDINKLGKDIDKLIGRNDLTDSEIKQLEQYKQLAKINQLELMKARTAITMKEYGLEMREEMFKYLGEATINDLIEQCGIYGDFNGAATRLDAQMLQELIYGTDERLESLWSKRLWNMTDEFANDVNYLLAQKLSQQITAVEFAAQLKKYVSKNVKRPGYVAKRLARTESARIEGEVNTTLWEMGGYEFYEFIAEGGHVCEKCKPLDGKVYKISEQQAGVNFYPMHPNCRCSAVAATDPDFNYDAWLDSLGGQHEAAQHFEQLSLDLFGD